MRNPANWIGFCGLAVALGGCASGMSHVQKFSKEIMPLDAAAAVGGFVLYSQGLNHAWDVKALPEKADPTSYRITLTHSMWVNAGDGDASLVFRNTAEKLVADHACLGYRTLRYEERLETVAIGARRVVDGIVECIPNTRIAAMPADALPAVPGAVPPPVPTHAPEPTGTSSIWESFPIPPPMTPRGTPLVLPPKPANPG